jgi:transposase InsO family protein
MPTKRHSPEEIVSKLLQVDVTVAQGQPIAAAVKTIRVAKQELRDEFLEGENFYSLREAEILIESWRVYYNTQRPHSSLGYRPHAPEVVLWPASPAWGSARPATQPVAPGTPLN